MLSPPPDHVIKDYPLVAAIDTCSISNLLCSAKLRVGIKNKKMHFLLAEYVRYECLVRKRRTPSIADQEVMDRLKSELAIAKNFTVMALEVSDLREISRHKLLNRLGLGELASLVLAKKYRQGFTTDDRQARRLGAAAFPDIAIRTTSHLVGWLFYIGEISDADIPEIIKDNERLRGEHGSIGKYIKTCYEHACMLLLRDRQVTSA